MEQVSMHFYDDEYEALNADILAAGGYKRLAVEIWPDKKMETAYAQLKAVVNPDKAEKLSLSELSLVVRKARQAKSCAYVTYLSDKCDLTRPNFRDPEDEKIMLQKAAIEAVKNLQNITERLERLERLEE